MYKILNLSDLAMIIGGEFYDGLDLLYENFKDMQSEASKIRFNILRAEAINRYGENNFLEFIDHTFKRVYYIKLADSDELFANPYHPYTKALLSAIPVPDPHYEKKRKRIIYRPEFDSDHSEAPELREVKPGHFVRCTSKEFEKIQTGVAH